MVKKLKIGIIGSGGIAQGAHMPGYASIPELCEMVWACDIDPNVAEEAAEKFGGMKTTGDYRDVIADPEVDAVSIATPNKYHVEPTIAALEAGKHVLCEKPLAMNAEEARSMVRAARKSGLILQVGMNNRFTGPAQFMKQYIDDGNLGDVYYARAQALRRRGVPGWGVFIDKEKQGGGPLIDIGVHILDLTLHFMGFPKPVSASGMTWNHLGTNPALFNNWGDYDRTKFTVEDFAVGLIRFDNGAVVVLESSFMGNLEGDPFQCQLFGTKAGAAVRTWGENPIEIYTEQNRQVFNLKPVNIPNVTSSHVAEVQAFVEAILEKKPSPVPAEHGFYVNAIFDALYRSAATGVEERIDVSV
ncbi:MAG: Gfo/Idh/MocA family oxidoreductase [Fimbriimonadaceae bacterium]|nr:Gfo/Idh/MocA family oxidoreductase [Fimbriimonadaceae bacterium]QOJ12831.1 MAG: Gfo/Idh/MocA family oxidoreductase [Chthonomonadaceae bacterium]